MCTHPQCVIARAIQEARVELAGLVRGSDAWLTARKKIEDLIAEQARIHQLAYTAEQTMRAVMEDGIPILRFESSSAPN